MARPETIGMPEDFFFTGATGASVTLTASNNPGDVLTCTATATDSPRSHEEGRER